MRKLIFVFFIFFASSVFAGENYAFAREFDRLRFQHLTHEFRCLVCQNQDLASSDASLAQDLRAQIYTLVNSGESDEDIVSFMVERYGEFVLFKPPMLRSTLFLWLAPLLLALAGAFVLTRSSLKLKHKA